MEIFSKVKKVEDGNFFNQSLSNAYIEDVDLDASMGAIVKEEDGDFFNLNLSSAYIEDVDLDASFGTITKVEQFDYNSFIESKLPEFEELFESENNKYYKIVITKGKQRGSSTLANGSFEWLKFAGRRTLNYTSNMTTEDIYFEDINGNEIECTCSYLSGRWSDNYSSRDYAPSNFFATNAEESWVSDKSSTVYSEIISSGSELKYQILFKTKIPLEYINGLVFDNGRDSGWIVSVVVYSSDDLETFTELINEDLPSGNAYTFNFDPAEYKSSGNDEPSNDENVDTYKIVLTASDSSYQNTGVISSGSFENLEYDSGVTYGSTSDDIIFTDGENYYNCRVSMSSRWRNANGDGNYSPHNLFAPSNKRTSPYSAVFSSDGTNLIYTIHFTDPISLELLSNLHIVAGSDPDGGSGTVKYELYDSDDTLLYETTQYNANCAHNYVMTFNPIIE